MGFRRASPMVRHRASPNLRRGDKPMSKAKHDSTIPLKAKTTRRAERPGDRVSELLRQQRRVINAMVVLEWQQTEARQKGRKSQQKSEPSREGANARLEGRRPSVTSRRPP